MNFILDIIQIVVSVLLTITILLQQRGTGVGGAFGGGGSESYYKKRGMEKAIFTASVVLAILFILTAALRIFF